MQKFHKYGENYHRFCRYCETRRQHPLFAKGLYIARDDPFEEHLPPTLPIYVSLHPIDTCSLLGMMAPDRASPEVMLPAGDMVVSRIHCSPSSDLWRRMTKDYSADADSLQDNRETASPAIPCEGPRDDLGLL